MINSTRVSYFILSAYVDTGLFKYLWFMIIMSLYVIIVCSNLLLIVVICMNRSLHEPMYLFLCSLFVNELFGSSGLFPFLLVQILSDIHTVSHSSCYLQIFCLYFYACLEFFNLAIMSYDRYLAICYPLHYSTRMTFKRLTILLAVSWVWASVSCNVPLILSRSLQLCGNIIDKVYCDNYPINKLACSDTTANNIYGLFSTCLTVALPVSLILFSYMRILKVCYSGSKQTRQKALSTCSPHLASLLNFSFGCCFEIIQSRFDMSRVPRVLRIVLSLYFLIIQPLFNPIMFGLQMSKIRNTCKNVLCHKRLNCCRDRRLTPNPL